MGNDTKSHPFFHSLRFCSDFDLDLDPYFTEYGTTPVFGTSGVRASVSYQGETAYIALGTDYFFSISREDTYPPEPHILDLPPNQIPESFCDGLLGLLTSGGSSDARSRFEFLVSACGSVRPLGGLAFFQGTPFVEFIPPEDIATLGLSLSAASDRHAKPCILSVYFSGLSPSRVKQRLVFNHFHNDWEFFRAVGINIPRLLLYEFLGVSAKPLPMMPKGSLSNSGGKPRLNLSFSTLSLDLDDTLIYRGSLNSDLWAKATALAPTVSLQLVTRNPGPIAQILREAGCDPSSFAELVYVEPMRKKSSVIRRGSVLVDNEFRQRLDVWSSLGIPCLDVDQVDFLV